MKRNEENERIQRCHRGRELNNQKKAEVRSLVKRDKAAYWNGVALKLEEAHKTGNLRSAYQILNMQYTPSCSRQLPDLMRLADGASSDISLECSELKRSYFSQLLNVRRSTSADVNLVQPVESCQINVEPPTLQEVSDAINLLKNNKAACVCEISAEMIKYGGDVIVEAVFQLISQI